MTVAIDVDKQLLTKADCRRLGLSRPDVSRRHWPPPEREAARQHDSDTAAWLFPTAIATASLLVSVCQSMCQRRSTSRNAEAACKLALTVLSNRLEQIRMAHGGSLDVANRILAGRAPGDLRECDDDVSMAIREWAEAQKEAKAVVALNEPNLSRRVRRDLDRSLLDADFFAESRSSHPAA